MSITDSKYLPFIEEIVINGMLFHIFNQKVFEILIFKYQYAMHELEILIECDKCKIGKVKVELCSGRGECMCVWAMWKLEHGKISKQEKGT